MYLSIGVIVVMGVIAYIWSARGLWSAFLHMLCVILAGALAFAVWEPGALFLLSQSGGGEGWLSDNAWGLSLALSFVVFLVILRVICDQVVPFNLDMPSMVNIVGGLGCGLVAGLISAGILALSVGYMRMPTELLGHQAVTYDAKGQLIRTESLIVPADRLTAWFYSTLSNSSLLPPSGESLGRRRPQLADEGWMLRTNFGEGKSRNTTSQDSFEVISRYTVTPSSNPDQIITDSFEPGKQDVTYPDGTRATPSQSALEGFIIRFKSLAKEGSGRVILGPGQLRLVVQTDPNDLLSTKAIQAMALISQATGDKPTLGRWRFNAKDVFISSSPGRDDAPVAIEFMVPRGSKPVALYLKGTPVNVSGLAAARNFTTVADRDKAIQDRSIAPSQAAVAMNRAEAVRIRYNSQDATAPIRLSDGIPYGIVLQKDLVKGLELDERNRVSGGELSKFTASDIKAAQGVIEQTLRVSRMSVPDESVIVQVVVDSKNAQFGFLSPVAANIEGAPVLVDDNGQSYSAVGYLYRTTDQTWLYYNLQGPIKTLGDREMPTITRSQPDQQLTLMFLVPKGIKIKEFAVGDKVLAEFAPEIQTGR